MNNIIIVLQTLQDEIGGIFALLALFAGIGFLISRNVIRFPGRNVSTEAEKKAEKSDEQRIINSLQIEKEEVQYEILNTLAKIEHHTRKTQKNTLTIMWFIFCLVLLAVLLKYS